MEIIAAILLGISLSASCGFRIFIPLLLSSIAIKTGYMPASEGFAWMGSDMAIIAFSLATILEIIAYYIPVIDNALDAIGTPLAAIAGTCIAAAFITDIDPSLHWILSIIAGGGTATAIHAGTSTARAVSTPATLGTGNWLIATFEAIASFVTSVLAMISPLVMGVVILLLLIPGGWLVFKLVKKLKNRKSAATSES